MVTSLETPPSPVMLPGHILIEGKISKVVTRKDNGWTILSINDKKHGYISVVGEMPEFSQGTKVHGEAIESEHPKFGKQYKIVNIEAQGFEDEEGLIDYLSSSIFKGIGKSTAKDIVAQFGMDTLKVLDETPEKLGMIRGLSKKWESIVEEYNSHKSTNKMIAELMLMGLTINQATKAVTKFEANTIKLIKENPYILIELPGIGFETADKFALRNGVNPRSDFRVDAAIIYAMQKSLNESGHCYMEISVLNSAVVDLLHNQLGTTEVGKGIRRLESDKKLIINDTTKVYTLKAWDAEKYVSGRIKTMLNYEHNFDDIVKIDSRADLMKRLEEINALDDIILSEEQLQALETAINERVCIITGGPGTGKSAITKVLCELLRHYHVSYSLCSPTGRAAKRLAEATGDPTAQTIHRLLKYDPITSGFTFDEFNRLPVHCVIVDETSMVDIFLMESLISAIDDDRRIIFIGDVDQLPSVGAGTVLKDLIDSNIIPTVRLKKVYRQGNGSTIITVAHKINNGITPELPSPSQSQGQNCIFVNAPTKDNAQNALIKLIETSLPKINVSPNDIQILTPMRIGDLGVESLNPMLQNILNPHTPEKQELKTLSGIFRVDDKVMQIKNNYDKEVFNGDIGVVANIVKNENGTTVKVKYPDKIYVVDYTLKELEELNLAYAISVHKSQGGEFPVVIMLLHDMHSRMLQRNLVYTGVTRAKKLFIFVGTDSALERAVNNKVHSRRNTTLKEFLKN